MFNRQSMHEGMTVRSADGEKLGTILALGRSDFQIEKGIFFKEDFVTSYENVKDIEGEEVILARGQDSLVSAESGVIAVDGRDDGSTESMEMMSSETADRGNAVAGLRSANENVSDEVRMPLAEERLDVAKQDRRAGEVRLKKEVVSELKTVEVPVTREEVRVERVAATASAPASASFKEETVSMPLREEEVVVSKRPVVREEVRLKKDRVQETRQVSDTVRREEATVVGQELSADDEVTASARRDGDADPLV